MTGYIDYAAQAYGADPGVLAAVNKLENSGSDAFTINNWDSNAKKGTPSAGPFQFIEPTFKSYADSARKANPGAWKGIAVDWRNPQAQALAAAWAIKNGHGSAWSTYQKALASAGHGAAPSAAAPAPTAPRYGLVSPVQPVFTGTSFGGGSKNDAWFGKFVDASSARASAAAAARAAPAYGSASSSAAPAPQAAGTPGTDYKGIEALGSKYGLTVQGDFQTTGGKHAPGSSHYLGKAVDFGDATNSQDKLFAFAAYAKANPGQFKELYFNKLGWGIRNGKVIKGLTVAGHDDHLHASVF